MLLQLLLWLLVVVAVIVAVVVGVIVVAAACPSRLAAPAAALPLPAWPRCPCPQ